MVKHYYAFIGQWQLSLYNIEYKCSNCGQISPGSSWPVAAGRHKPLIGHEEDFPVFSLVAYELLLLESTDILEGFVGDNTEAVAYIRE